jgi:membrane-associated phospholipid phosphatase
MKLQLLRNNNIVKTIFKGWLAAFFFLTVIINLSFAQLPDANSQFQLVNQIIHAEEDQAEEVEIQSNRGFWKTYISDTKSILTSPSRWERSDWIKASLIMGITVGLYFFDQDIQEWVQENRDDSSDNIARFVKPFGNGRYTLPPLGILYLYGHFYENEKARTVSLLSLESFIISGIFTQAIKLTGHRHRPNSGDQYDTWDGPSFSTDHLSFPSGHSTAAFSIATVIASEYEDNVLIPPLAYGIATLTALSRVNDNHHWTSDVFFGSAIGYFTAKSIIGLHGSKKERNFSILPVIYDKHTALLFSYNF